jgi:hypothetical protein
LGDWHFVAHSVIRFKRHFAPFNYFAELSIPALLRSVQKRSHLLKSAYLGLKIERSEILERCAAAFNNSSGTSCRSIASLRSAFQHCFAVFKKEVQSPIEICKAGIEDRTQ